MKLVFGHLIYFSLLFSQSLSVISELDTTEGFIGDIFKWSVKVEGKTDHIIQFPELKTINDSISLRNKYLIYENGSLVGIQFELMAWDTGHFILPEYSVNILNPDSSIQYTLETNQIGFSIQSILAKTDVSDFRPFKGPVPVRGVFPMRQVLLLILCVLLFFGMVWTWRQRLEPQYEKANYVFKESPEQRAIQRLGELDSNGLTKDFYAELSHISREYIETKYFIRTLEMTTEEIRKNKDLFPMSDNVFSKWIQFLSEADMVKYAKDVPISEKKNLDKDMIFSLIQKY